MANLLIPILLLRVLILLIAWLGILARLELQAPHLLHETTVGTEVGCRRRLRFSRRSWTATCSLHRIRLATMFTIVARASGSHGGKLYPTLHSVLEFIALGILTCRDTPCMLGNMHIFPRPAQKRAQKYVLCIIFDRNHISAEYVLRPKYVFVKPTFSPTKCQPK